MKKNPYAILFGSLLSILLFLVFAWLMENEVKFIELSTHWIFIAITPLIIALFVGGYITRFKGFGVELEGALSTPISKLIDLEAYDLMVDIPGDEKQSISYLNDLSDKRVRTIKGLIFELNKRDYYSPRAIREYFNRLINLEVVEVKSSAGAFVCYVPIDFFRKKEPFSHQERYDINRIEEFVDSLEDGNIKEYLSGIAISLMVESTDTWIQVLRAMKKSQVPMAAVRSRAGAHLGAIYRHDVERQVAEAVLSSSSA